MKQARRIVQAMGKRAQALQDVLATLKWNQFAEQNLEG
jgi:hypothetical protein